MLERLKGSDLPVRKIDEMREMAIRLSSVPEKPKYENRVVALIEWRDGTVIDTVRQLKLQD
jgi:citrate lyase subunit alpha/citrate CoA-transferase